MQTLGLARGIGLCLGLWECGRRKEPLAQALTRRLARCGLQSRGILELAKVVIDNGHGRQHPRTTRSRSSAGAILGVEQQGIAEFVAQGSVKGTDLQRGAVELNGSAAIAGFHGRIGLSLKSQGAGGFRRRRGAGRGQGGEEHGEAA